MEMLIPYNAVKIGVFSKAAEHFNFSYDNNFMKASSLTRIN